MNKIAVTGARGKIGSLMVKRGWEPLYVDVTNAFGVEGSIIKSSPALIFHLASKSNVNWCEREENQAQLIATNLRGAYNVFSTAESYGIPVVIISSDHIYDGRRGNYREVETKGKWPINQYGLSKLAVEGLAQSFDNVKIIRTSTLFSPTRNLIRQYLEPLEHREEIQVPTFLSRSFMYINDFVNALLRYAEHFYDMPKVLNISGGPKPVQWYSFVCGMADVFGLPKYCIKPQKDPDPNFDGAPRPHKAGLDISLARRLGIPCPDYMDGLRRMKADYV